jgi:hypothetical protein
LTFLLSAPAIGRKRLPDKLVGGKHEQAIGFRVRNLDDPQVSAGSCLAQSNPGTLAGRSILTGVFQNFRDFLLGHFVAVNMRRAGHGVDIESDVQASSTFILILNGMRAPAWRGGTQ